MNRELVAAILTATQAHLDAAQANLNALAAAHNVTLTREEAEGPGQPASPTSTNVPDEGECEHPEDRRQNISGLAGPRKFFCRDCRRKYEIHGKTLREV